MVGASSRLPAILAGLVALGATLPASAQDDASTTPPEAVQYYAEAREHYANGRYQEAANSLEEALLLDPESPTLVYNLARVRELLGDLEAAVELYEHYQRLLPQQQQREQERADATLRRLRGAQSSQTDDTPVAPPREVAPLRQLPGLVLVRENGVADGAFWVLLVAGAGLLATGAVFGPLALLERTAADEFVLGPDGLSNEWQNANRNAQSFGYVTDTTLGVGGAAVLVAGLLYFLREHTVERAPVRAVEGEGDSESSAASDGGAWAEPTAGATRDGGFVGLRGAF